MVNLYDGRPDLDKMKKKLFLLFLSGTPLQMAITVPLPDAVVPKYGLLVVSVLRQRGVLIEPGASLRTCFGFSVFNRKNTG